MPFFLKCEFNSYFRVKKSQFVVSDSDDQPRFSFSAGMRRQYNKSLQNTGANTPGCCFSKSGLRFVENRNSYKVDFTLVFSRSGPLLTEEFWPYVLNALFNQIVRLLEIQELENSLQQDDLTSLLNQNTLIKIIEREIAQNKLLINTFSLVFLDIDGLKDINEQFGHLTGSYLIKEFAALLSGSLRKSDVVARFGGDEFVFLLFHTSEKKAFAICERLRELITGHRFLTQKGLNLSITVSFGITAHKSADDSSEILIKRADKAMYTVKKKGKNGILIYRENAHGRIV